LKGEVFEIGSEAPDAPGYDLLALMIGSEGMLGVVTEVTVKLVPKPELAQVVMASFADVARPATRWRRSSPPASFRPGWR
jgi:glycolate oxidase